MKFIDSLIKSLETKKSHVCVGLDSRYDRIPESVRKNRSVADAIFSFNKHIIEATEDIAVIYKMNVAFYAGFGSEGLEGLRLTNELLRTQYSRIPIFADCKRSEMGESVGLVEKEIFDWLGFDCVMVTPWFGEDTVKGYLSDTKHGVCVYVHDSNPTASEFQDLEIKDGKKIYEVVTEHVVKQWNTNGNVVVEAGATYPLQLRHIRKIIGEEMPMLVAGIGAQGGFPEVLKGLFGKGGKRLVVNSSRGIIFAGVGKKDYFEEVRQKAKDLQIKLQQIAAQT